MAATDTMVLSDYSDWMKEYYTNQTHKARKRQNVFLDDEVIKISSDNVVGKYALIPVEFISYAGVGSRDENQSLPTPVEGNYDSAKAELTYTYASMQFSGQLQELAVTDPGAFADGVGKYMDTLMDAWNFDINRQILGDATGYLCMNDGGWATRTADVDNAWGIADDANGDLLLSPGMMLNAFNSDDTKRSSAGDGSGNMQIKSMTRGSGSTEATITLIDTDVTTGVVDDDYFIRAGNKADGSSDTYEASGLRLMVDDGTLATTYENISTDTQEDWKALVHYGSTPGTAEPLTRTRMMRLLKQLKIVSGANPDFIFCGLETQTTYEELADSFKIVHDWKALDAAGNWSGPTFNNLPIIADPIYPEGRMEFIDRDVVRIYQTRDPHWIDGDIGYFQKVASYDNWRAEYKWYWQFVCTNRSRMGSLRDITTVFE